MVICEECEEDYLLVAIVSDFYRCVLIVVLIQDNISMVRIRYLKLDESDKKWIKDNYIK